MAYSNALKEKANSILIARRNSANEEYLRNKEIIYRKIPEIREIDRSISNTGLKVAAAVLRSNNVEETLKQMQEENLSLQRKKINLLVDNGFSPDALKIKYHCEKCSDTGRTQNGMCECLKEILKELAYEQLSEEVDVKRFGFHNFSLDYYPDTVTNSQGKTARDIMDMIYKYCVNYASNFDEHSPSLLFLGGTGLGKTHLSIAIAGYVLEKGYDIIYSSAQNLLYKLERERFSRDSRNDSYEDSIQLVLNCDLLILDDLGAEFTTPFTVSTLYNIVNSRLLQGKPTIISSNVDIPQKLEERYTERFVSRLFGNYKVMKFMGKDIRIMKKTGNER